MLTDVVVLARTKVNIARETLATLDFLKESFPELYFEAVEALKRAETEFSELETGLSSEDKAKLNRALPLKTFQPFTREDFERGFLR